MKRILFVLVCLLLTLPLTAAKKPENPVDLAAATAATKQAAGAVLDELYDHYFQYYTVKEYTTLLGDYTGVFGGVGISMIEKDGQVVVAGIIEDMPAADSEVAVGDAILAVDGVELPENPTTDDAAAVIRGDIGTEVTIRFLREVDGAVYECTFIRTEVKGNSVKGERLQDSENTAYFLLYDFNGETDKEFADLYNELLREGPIDHIVLDLRSNSGGNFYAAVYMADYFVPKGHIVVSEKTPEGDVSYKSESGTLHGKDLIVLQNGWSASASEVLIGALRDEADAAIIGSVSFGKGITQSVEKLADGSGLRYTRSRYYTPSGYDLHGVGIEPDIVVETPDDAVAEDYFSTDPSLDPHLAAALEYIRSQ